MSIGGYSYWHVECAKNWASAFMRDVWEATKAARNPPADPDPYVHTDSVVPGSEAHETRPAGPTPLNAQRILQAPVPNDWRIHMIQEAAGQSVHRLTDLLTRPVGTGETARDTSDAQ